jgi:hypothetical protein
MREGDACAFEPFGCKADIVENRREFGRCSLVGTGFCNVGYNPRRLMLFG